jgi:hypothetical protein
VAREDHKHAFPAGAAPSALTVSSTQATGTSTAPALADHVHAMPGSAVAGASAVGDTAATGTATTVALSDHRHSREAFGTPVVVNGQTTSLATGSLTTLARADHVHTLSNVPTLLASTTMGSDAASISISALSTSYSTLLLVYCVRTSYTTGAYEQVGIRFNDDSGSNYSLTTGTATANWESGYAASTGVFGGVTAAANVLYVTAANNTTNHKTCTGTGNTPISTTVYTTGVYNTMGIWRSTAQITKITWLLYNASNIKSGSSFSVYGIP